jgi:hypothetical protein
MFFRAIFWIAVVALFMPHGQGAPGDDLRCRHIACSASLGLLDRVRTAGLHRLAVVRAQIEDAERARNSG